MKKGWRIFFYLEVLVHFRSLRVRLWQATGTQKKDSFSTIIFHGPYLKSKRSSLNWFKQVFDSNDSVSRHPSITNHQTLKFLQTEHPNKKLTTRFFLFFFWDRQIRRQIYVLDANPGADCAPIWSKQSPLLEAKHVGYLAH